MQIAVFEPYYGGSHKYFLDSLQTFLPGSYRLFTLPARKWKWRMRLAAPYFAEQIRQHPEMLEDVDVLLCSTFLDVAVFRGLLPPRFKSVPVALYFHENQFAYPVQVDDERDFHFALTNLTSALAADSLAFNSRYNLTTFVQGAEKLLNLIYDMSLDGWKAEIEQKSTVLHPGIDFSAIDGITAKESGTPPVIVWNHRWEHDKNPQLFFESLRELKERGYHFRLIILGQSFKEWPQVFVDAREIFAAEIDHIGYLPSQKEYYKMLTKGDIVVSTADHEFYGISILEAVRAGCRPLLPKELVYPELFEERYLYEPGGFVNGLERLLLDGCSFSRDQGRAITEKFSWPMVREQYRSWFKTS